MTLLNNTLEAIWICGWACIAAEWAMFAVMLWRRKWNEASNIAGMAMTITCMWLVVTNVIGKGK